MVVFVLLEDRERIGVFPGLQKHRCQSLSIYGDVSQRWKDPVELVSGSELWHGGSPLAPQKLQKAIQDATAPSVNEFIGDDMGRVFLQGDEALVQIDNEG